MKSSWSDADAASFLERYAPEHGEELALRVYSSQLIGSDPDLVLHGGGNTSVKTTRVDVFGERRTVLHVKGSGHDLRTIEPAGMATLDLERVRRLAQLNTLDDHELVNQLRMACLDARAPAPSLETLLHAFLPHAFVDHTHADALLVLTNQPDGETRVRDALGANVVVLPWAKPGFQLARAVLRAQREHPDADAFVLLHHGVFTFADDARTSYERMIDVVDRAERYLDDHGVNGVPATRGAVSVEDARHAAARFLPVVRGALALDDPGTGSTGTWFVAEHRVSDEILAFAERPDAERLLTQGPLTPDHVIRTKSPYLFLDLEQAKEGEDCRLAVDRWADSYRRAFERHRDRIVPEPTMLDPHPRVVVCKGMGLVAFGEDKRAACIAADIAEHTLRGMARAEALGTYAPLGEGELFDMEYWPLERAKLTGTTREKLAGRIALVTGAAGAIGNGIAEALLDAGAHVFLTDLNETALAGMRDRLAERFRPERIAFTAMDVTDEVQVAKAFDDCVFAFGGVDCVVPNAGVAHVSDLQSMDLARFRKVLDVNLTGTLTVLKVAAQRLAQQGTGGSIVVQGSKNVFDPGARFGAYSASKAGAQQLGKIAALELAAIGVRVNMVHADAVFGDRVESGLWAEVGPDRMRARGLDPEGLKAYYRDRSLLKVEVTPRHVGEAVVFFASHATPTTGASLPVDAGVAGAFPR